jgi:hypothetical protein
MKLPSRLFPFVLVAAIIQAAAGNTATVLDSLLSLLPGPYQSVVSHYDRYYLQILYTQIDRDHNNRPHFTHFAFHVNPKLYFYPASLVKLPMAALALEKINRLKIGGLTRRSPMEIDNTLNCSVWYGTSDDRLPDSTSLEASIKRMLLLSDNGSYNRLWEFLTRDFVNQRLTECGYPEMRILHRLSSCGAELNRVSNPVRFIGKNDTVLYSQRVAVSHLPDANPLAPFYLGSFSSEDGALIARPFRGDYLNYVPLETIHRFLITIMFPATADRAKPLLLTAEDYKLLRTWMCMLPRESGVPRYVPDSGYKDNFKKFLLFGDSTHPCVPSLREFNVVGRAYGFQNDVAYFADFDEKVEFFLSATMFANEDDVINDDHYEYASLALPFFSALGSVVYEYEKKRHRRCRPDLREFVPALPVVKQTAGRP